MVTYGKGLNSLLSFVMSNCYFVTFQCGILGQAWYLIVLIPDVCRLSYFFLTYGVIFLVVMILNLLVNRLMRRSQQKSSAFLVC